MVSLMTLGFVATGLALLIMMAWAYIEVQRIDEIREQVDDELAERAAAEAREEE